MKKIICTIAVSLVITLNFAHLNAQNSLIVKISDLSAKGGNLMIALFDSPEKFMTDKAVDAKIVKIDGETSDITFDNLPDGKYAITFFQDENKNSKLDLGQYGIPTEKYGFSNNIDPAVVKGPPGFKDCEFEIKGNTVIEIKAVSAIK